MISGNIMNSNPVVYQGMNSLYFDKWLSKNFNLDTKVDLLCVQIKFYICLIWFSIIIITELQYIVYNNIQIFKNYNNKVQVNNFSIPRSSFILYKTCIIYVTGRDYNENNYLKYIPGRLSWY